MQGITRCSHCDQEVRVPSASLGAIVRCPHCCIELPWIDVVTRLPPLMEVVSPGSINDVVQVERDLDADNRLLSPNLAAPVMSFRHVVDATTGPSDDESAGSVAGVVVRNISRSTDGPLPRGMVAKVPTPQKLHAERKKERRMSSQNSPIKVILGGAAGIGLGQLVLWWMPVPYRSDPFELVPVLPPALHFLAPASLRGEGITTSKAMAEGNGSQRVEAAEDKNEVGSSLARSIDTRLDGTSAAASHEDEANARSRIGSSARTAALNVPDSSSEMLLGLADAPRLSMTELRESLISANRAYRAYVLGPSDAVDSTTNWYQQLCGLAYSITFADMTEKGLSEFGSDVRKSVRRMMDPPKHAQVTVSQAEKLFAIEENDRKGIVFVGTVREISTVGKLYQSDLELTDGTTTIPVISRFDPRENGAFELDETVLILGVIVRDPARYLLGYDGTTDVVVLGGLPIRHFESH